MTTIIRRPYPPMVSTTCESRQAKLDHLAELNATASDLPAAISVRSRCRRLEKSGESDEAAGL